MQTEFFDCHDRLGKLDKNENPIVAFDKIIDWEQFRPIIEKLSRPKKKSSLRPKYHDEILMFKVLILRPLYNISDDAFEFQILDRLSFMISIDGKNQPIRNYTFTAAPVYDSNIFEALLKVKIGLRNLAYNMNRYKILAVNGISLSDTGKNPCQGLFCLFRQ